VTPLHKIVLGSSKLHEGRLIAKFHGGGPTAVLRTADTLGIRGANGEVHLPLAAVDSLWVRRHYTQAGFLIGALIGGGRVPGNHQPQRLRRGG
jgi:hypothetical protein